MKPWAAFWDTWTAHIRGDFAVGQRTRFDVLRIGTFAHGQRAFGARPGPTLNYREEHGLDD